MNMKHKHHQDKQKDNKLLPQVTESKSQLSPSGVPWRQRQVAASNPSLPYWNDPAWLAKHEQAPADGKPKTTYTWEPYKPCHDAVVEILDGLWIGKRMDVENCIEDKLIKPDVIVPLAGLDGDIWKIWRGEFLYYPISDYHTLPADVLTELVDKIIDRLQHKKQVAICCIGGHGRTGMVAACVFGGIRPDLDPVEYIHKNYCKKAIDNQLQLDAIADFLGREELKKHEVSKPITYSYGYGEAVYTYDRETDTFIVNPAKKDDKPLRQLDGVALAKMTDAEFEQWMSDNDC